MDEIQVTITFSIPKISMQATPPLVIGIYLVVLLAFAALIGRHTHAVFGYLTIAAGLIIGGFVITATWLAFWPATI